MHDDASAMILGGGGDNLHRLVGQRIGFWMEFDKPQIPRKRKQAGRIIG